MLRPTQSTATEPTVAAPRTGVAGWTVAKLAEWFGIDPRSLALFRIGMGLIVLVDLLTRLPEAQSMLGGNGIMPIADAQAWWGTPLRWSLLFLSDSPWLLYGIFAVGILSALAMIVGCASRAATISCWLIVVSIQNRCPLIEVGGDAYVRFLLFWSMFLPLGRCWSIDARRRGRIDPRPVANVLTFCLLMQVCLVYFATGNWKICEPVWREGLGLEHALRVELFSRPLAYWLLEHPTLTMLLSYGALAMELGGPFLAFSPVWTKQLRVLAVMLFCSFHIGIEMTMSVSWFSYASVVAWMLFLPPAFWENRWWKTPLTLGQGATAPTIGPQPRSWPQGMAVSFLSVFYGFSLICVVLWIVGCMHPSVRKQTPEAFKTHANLFSLPQAWIMFFAPPKLNWWYIADADLRNGEQVDLVSGDPVTTDKPANLRTHFGDYRWRQVHVMLIDQTDPRFATSVARCLASRWNAAHGEEEQVVEVRFRRIRLANASSDYPLFENRILATIELEERPPQALDLDDLLQQGF